MNLGNILLSFGNNPQGGQKADGGWSSLLMIGLIIVVFYFFMIRPQMKRSKEERKYRENLQKGDKVVTAGGIHGKVIEINESSLLIEIAHNVNITVEKTSVVVQRQDNKR